MKLELKEHELEQAIEVFISSFVNKPVKVNGFDLSGMRSKDGLSAMVDITVLGVSDVREPKTESVNVNPTNTSWRESKEDGEDLDETRPTVLEQKSEFYYEVLGLLSDNPMNKHNGKIQKLLQEHPELESELSTNVYYVKWKELTEDSQEVIPEPVNNTLDTTLDKEEEELNTLTLSDEPKDNSAFEEEEPLTETVTQSILDEVTQPESKQEEADRVTDSLFSKPKQVRPLFG